MKNLLKLFSLMLITIFASCDNFPIPGGEEGENDNTGNNGNSSGLESDSTGTTAPETSFWVKYIDKLNVEYTDYDDDTIVYEYSHDYDEQDRITCITEKVTDDDEVEITTCTFDYSIYGEINAKINDGNDEETGRGLIGANGLIKTLYEKGEDSGEERYYIKQDSSSFITELREQHIEYYGENKEFSSVDEYTTIFGYNNGMLSMFDGETFPTELFKDRYINDKINIDINWFLFSGFDMEMPSLFAYTRNFGSMGNYIIEMGSEGDHFEFVGTQKYQFTEDPNYREHVSRTYFERTDKEPESEMIFDEAGCPTVFKFEFEYEQYKEEWDYIAGNPVKDQYYEIISTEKITTKTNVVKTCTVVYTFKYREDK